MSSKQFSDNNPSRLEHSNQSPAGLISLSALVVACAGLFAAGVLSVGHLLNIPVPCGSGDGCITVANHPSSKFLGVPIALVGVSADVAIVFLLTRAGAKWARIALAAITGTGAIISAALLVYAQTVIKATCLWCVASGVAMVLLCVLSIMLVMRSQPVSPVKPALAWQLGFVALLAVGVQGWLMGRAATAPPIPAERVATVPVSELVDPAKSMGPPDAPVTIVEFADLWCPACRMMYGSLHTYQQSNPAGVRIAFRHLPLWKVEGHRSSRAAAALSEIAAERGQFWQFVDSVYSRHTEMNTAGYLALMKSLGFDPKEVEARLATGNDPAIARVLQDEELAARLGVTATPTFLVVVDGMDPIPANQKTLARILNSQVVLAKLGKAAQRKSP